MKTYYIKWIIGTVAGLTTFLVGGDRLAAQTAGTTEASTYSNDSSKAAKVATSISIEYPKLTSTYACVGDTIYVTATADNIEDLIVPVDNNVHKYWSGDADNAVVEQTSTSITKRFYTYHPYKEAIPTTEKSKDFDFIIKKDGTKTTVTTSIIAKSCPPTTTTTVETKATDQFNGPDAQTKEYHYSLGYADFTYVLQNPSTDPSKVKAEPVIDPQPELALFCWLQTEFSKAANRWQITYRALPTHTETYDIVIVYNEGDSTGRRVKPFAPKIYTRTVNPSLDGLITADKTAYCSGDEIQFSLTIPEIYEKMLLQYAKGEDIDKIAQCFDWTTPDNSQVKLVSWDKDAHTYHFSATASGVSKDYKCTMSVRLRHISSARESSSNPRLQIDTAVKYDLKIQEFAFHSAATFGEKVIDACQGKRIDLSDYLLTKTGMRSMELSTISPNAGFAPGSTFEVPANSTTVYAKITTDFSCPSIGSTFIDSIKINVTPKPVITAMSVTQDTMICQGERLMLSAQTNPEAKATVTWAQETATSGPSPIEPGLVSIPGDVTITVSAQNGCDTDVQSFKVKMASLPSLSFAPASAVEACPYESVNLHGNGGSPISHILMQNNQSITPDGFSSQTGLTGYSLKPGDDLVLVYTASASTTATGYTPHTLSCPASISTTIKARPQPEVKITYDGQAYGDGATICVPRNQPLTLTASGADSYLWDNHSTAAQTTYNIQNDQSITVEGTENTHGCKNTVNIHGVVSVNPVGSTSESICPGDGIRFAADDLPDTKYDWRDPKGNIVGDNYYEYQASDIQPGQEGAYTLDISRSICTWTLTYQLAFHPYPDLTVMANNPVCQGDELVFNYLHGLPATERPTYSLKRADGSEVSGGQLTGDRVIYRIPDIQPAQAGTYTFTISTQNCTDIDITEIEVDQPVDANIHFAADQTTFCEDETTLLTAEALPDGDYHYKWFNNARTVYEGNEPRIPVIWQRADNGTLYLEIIQRICRSTAQKDITVIERPHLSGMPQDTGLCTGMPLCLNPVADLTPDQISWFFIGMDGVVTSLSQGANPDLAYCWKQVDSLMNGGYFVRAGHQGCIGYSDTMSLTVYPLPDIRIEGPDFICDGATVTLTAVSGTPGTNRWSPSGKTADTVRVTEAGRYAVTRTSTHGCRDSAETSLESRPLPYFSLPADTSICRGTSFMIYGPDDMDAYLWNDGSEEKDRMANDEGWYILTAFRNECPFSDSLYVHESFCGQFHFPTAFSPNDNRINDAWGAISAAKDEDMAEYDLMVFDRNGKKVFHGKRISEQWDGTYKGQLCPPGVYTYSFHAVEKEEGLQYRASGTVTIVL